MRGEKSAWSGRDRPGGGSPPHARGKGEYRNSACKASGITPACAGKRSASRSAACRCRGHPRIRGEKMAAIMDEHVELGSPPHTRGKVLRVRLLLRVIGITPAYAGKSAQPAGSPGRLWDHPRIRGEKRCRRMSLCQERGSPPHARGKVRASMVSLSCDGITPAYAGKRFAASRSAAVT